MFEYTYFIGVLLLGCIWVLFYVVRPDLRKQQMVMSIFTMPLAPISQFFFFAHDYWRPEYIYSISIQNIPIGIEEPLFAFFVGGIGSVLYEIIRRRKCIKSHARGRIGIFLLCVTVAVFLLCTFLPLNTIWASSISLLMGSILMIAVDRDLITDALFSGVTFIAIAYIVYFVLLFLDPTLFDTLWIEGGLSGSMILGVPIEELVWFFAWGCFSGVLYEFYVNVEKYVA